jgi:hypothetical protein
MRKERASVRASCLRGLLTPRVQAIAALWPRHGHRQCSLYTTCSTRQCPCKRRSSDGEGRSIVLVPLRRQMSARHAGSARQVWRQTRVSCPSRYLRLSTHRTE